MKLFDPSLLTPLANAVLADKHPEHITLITSTPCTQRSIAVFYFGPANAERKIYLQAALHADELPGALVLHKLCEVLQRLEDAGRLRYRFVVVPMANPIGLAQHLWGNCHVGRFDLTSRENFNRGFPDLVSLLDTDGPLRLEGDAEANTATVRAAIGDALCRLQASSELESLRLALIRLAFDADWVLDLHCDAEAVPHLYCGTDLWPEVRPLAQRLGCASALLSWTAGGHSFDEACSRPWWELRQRHGDRLPLACRAVTIELRGQADVSDAQADADAEGLIAFFTEIGAIDMPADVESGYAFDTEEVNASPLEGTELLRAPLGGVVVHRVPVGTQVSPGQAVSDIVDPCTGQRRAVASEFGGILFARTRARAVYAGSEVAKIAGVTAWRGGNLLSM